MATADFKFLRDKPLETSKELSDSKFGHDEISITLSKIVAKCPTPFTIGLFAKWGAGKSTVANALREQLPKSNIPVVIFDVWKHEGDALRRTFLKEMVQQLEGYGSKFFESGFKLDDRLQKSVGHSAETKFVFQPKKLRQTLIVGSVGVVILGIIGFVAKEIGELELFKHLLVTITGFSGGGAFVLWLLKESVRLFSNETTTYGVDRFEDPHEFEEEFHRILKSLKHPRILIVFDNLDRVTHDKVAILLATIKTFLEPRNIDALKKEAVFLVPCDARAIKQHLHTIYGASTNSAFDPDEFLRKFFNSILWIPDFIPTELESFARARLKDTNVELFNNDYVAWIITKAFRNNPRQIIQFVNILLANYLLVQEREGDGKDFPRDFLKDNIPQLTKYLVLNQLFPDQMEALREKKLLNLENVDSQDLANRPDTKVNNKAFVDFIRETPSIPITNLRIFFTLRRSEQEKKFAGFDSFIALLEDQKSEDSKKYFEQLGDFQNTDLVDSFSQAMKTGLEEKTNPVSLINLIYTLLKILDEKKILLKDTVYGEINNALRHKCKDEIHVVPPDLLDRALLQRYPTYRSDLILLWLSVMTAFVGGNPKKISRERIDGIAEVFSNRFEYLSDAQATTFRGLLENNLSGDLSIGKIVAGNLGSQKRFLTQSYILKFIGAVPDGVQVDEIIERFEVFKSLDDSYITDLIATTLIEKLTKIQAAENQRTPNNDREKLCKEITQILRLREQNILKVPAPIRDTLIGTEIACFNSIPQWDLRGAFIPLFVELRKLATQQRQAEIDNNIIGGYLNNTSPNLLASIINSLPDTERTGFFENPFNVHAENRSLNDAAFRQAYYPHLSDNKKRAFLQRLFTHNFDFGLQFVEIQSEPERSIVESVFDSFWANFDSRPLPFKKRILNLINKWKAWSNEHIQDLVTGKLRTLLCTLDQSQQQVGFEAIQEGKRSWISTLQSRRIAKEVFDWLVRPDVSDKYQPGAIRTVLAEDGQFNAEEKGQLRQFVLDELIRKGRTAPLITLGFEVLKGLSTSYSERPQNFEDIYNIAIHENDGALKQVLVGGLKGLVPGKISESEKDFWTRVQRL